VFIGLWFTIDGSRAADGFEAVLGVILVFSGALQLDRKAKNLERKLAAISSESGSTQESSG
jgi:hypothetical protein